MSLSPLSGGPLERMRVGLRLLRVELREKSREVSHFLVAVFEQTFSDPVGEELYAGLAIRSHTRGIEVAQPEATAHFAPIVRVAA